MQKEHHETQDEAASRPRSLTKLLWIKVLVIALIGGVIVYLVYYAAQYGKAQVILSPSDVTSSSQETVSRYARGSKVFFYVYRNNTGLDSEQVTVDVELYNGAEYRHHKKMSLETDKAYQKISSYLPAEYFSRGGKYRVNILMDGKKVSSQDVEVTD